MEESPLVVVLALAVRQSFSGLPAPVKYLPVQMLGSYQSFGDYLLSQYLIVIIESSCQEF